ncbi:hypothetical protein ACIQVE_01520 [Pseudomonas sp. NPDC098747]|uniref:hypothetical protein n=1 Tax=Pseudomonas sp. NPDC098747 TaxID=3364487 RepID=UPI00383A1DF5
MTPKVKRSLHWALIGVIALGCIFELADSDTPYKENTGYHTFSRQALSSGNQFSTEEHLIMNQRTFTLTSIENINAKPQSGTITAEVLTADKFDAQAQIKKLDLKQNSDLSLADVNPALFFKRQYALQEGSILSYKFFPTPNKDALCFYIQELNRLRCMHN